MSFHFGDLRIPVWCGQGGPSLPFEKRRGKREPFSLHFLRVFFFSALLSFLPQITPAIGRLSQAAFCWLSYLQSNFIQTDGENPLGKTVQQQRQTSANRQTLLNSSHLHQRRKSTIQMETKIIRPHQIWNVF